MKKYKRKQVRKYMSYKVVAIFTFLLVYTQPLYAYLDPGTGSMLVAVIVGIASTLFFLIRGLWYKAAVLVQGLLGSKKSNETTITAKTGQSIVFYSEGGQYWNTFVPVLRALDAKGISCSYLSSDEKDPGLSFESKYVQKKYIGKGNRAYFHLNLLKADLCVMTTPNFDVLQIRRSKQVKHYSHIIHAPTDLHLYNLFAFDFYDSMLLSGPEQEKSLRHLENVRNMKKKQSYIVGCSYMDELWHRKQVYAKQGHQSNHANTILIAPTWGESGLLSVCGESIFRSFVGSDYNIIVRPHPQSLIVESDMIAYLQDNFKQANNIHWDMSPDNFESLQAADILISDRSGIIFDYAFIFEKPVITHNTDTVLLGMEGNDISWNAWELDVLDILGATIHSKDIHTLPTLIDSTIKSRNTYLNAIRTLREKHVYHIGQAGEKSAEALIDIAQGLLKAA